MTDSSLLQWHNLWECDVAVVCGGQQFQRMQVTAMHLKGECTGGRTVLWSCLQSSPASTRWQFAQLCAMTLLSAMFQVRCTDYAANLLLHYLGVSISKGRCRLSQHHRTHYVAQQWGCQQADHWQWLMALVCFTPVQKLCPRPHSTVYFTTEH